MTNMIYKNKKLLSWLFGIAFFYSFLGFFIVPFFIKSQLIKVVKDNYLVTPEIDNIRFNPFNFELIINKILVPQVESTQNLPDNRFSAERIRINLELLYLFRKEIRLSVFEIEQGSASYVIFNKVSNNWKILSSQKTKESIENKEMSPNKTP